MWRREPPEPADPVVRGERDPVLRAEDLHELPDTINAQRERDGLPALDESDLQSQRETFEQGRREPLEAEIAQRLFDIAQRDRLAVSEEQILSAARREAAAQLGLR
ncbi:MAG TPA: hypothetical protein VHX88_00745 [Solirubrobacteraceae bacterium]|jgi:hypothetical protein|nr:hypothetical protein [Solirubrobacteraceae bacterium]